MDEITSTHKINVVELKKRKLQAEQLGLPVSKHKCWDRSFTCEPVSIVDGKSEVYCLHECIIMDKTKAGSPDDGSELESGKDSNRFAGDSDSIMSLYGESKLESEYPTTCLSDRPSTSSASWGCNSIMDTQCSADSLTATKTVADPDELEIDNVNDLEEQLLEFENHVDYMCSVYGNDSIEDCRDKESEDILYSIGMNPNMYVLSSGRWSVNPESQPNTRKPTIDQEFEQYFSMLML